VKVLLASGAATATDPDPVVVCIVRLLAAASVADDLAAHSASSLCSGTESGINEIVACWNSAPAFTCQDLGRSSSFLPEEKFSRKRIQLLCGLS